MTRTRLRALAALGLASTVLLTGCSAVPDFNPGVAARVADDTVSLKSVDDLTADYCSAVETQLQDGQSYPNHYLRGLVASSLALRAAADQFGAEHAVSAGIAYHRAVTQFAQQLSSLTPTQRDAVIEVQLAGQYVQDIQRAVGEQMGAPGGTKGQVAAGKKAFTAWLADNDVQIDPRFSVSIDSGAPVPTDTSVSYPVGDSAKKAGATDPDVDYSNALPETQRCG